MALRRRRARDETVQDAQQDATALTVDECTWPGFTPQAEYQKQILWDFQRATATREQAVRLLNEAEANQMEAEMVFEQARKALRRVAEGAI